MPRPFLALFALLGACALPPIEYRAEKEARWEATVAPELSGELITGEGPRTLAEAKGRVVIVEFWATFCDPCERSFPKYQALAERFGDSVAVIAVSLDEAADVKGGALQRFGQRTGAKFPLLWDHDGTMKRAYAPPSLPTSYVIDKSGNIAHVHVKYEAGDADVIAQEVEALISQAPATPGATSPQSPPSNP
jgi:cytochrome c biogenesis protein CcmG/thiol:disulfide interchange protein DsbE